MVLRSERAGRPQLERAQRWDVVAARALEALPDQTRWAVACGAEFRAEGPVDLWGILHHDGAFLRFTTWGGVERFVGVPMEFSWTEDPPGRFRIERDGSTAVFDTLEPLSCLVPDAPSYFVTRDEPLSVQLARWLRTWAPDRSGPLASPM